MSETALASRNQLVTFVLDEEEMAIPIQRVQEIIRLPDVTKIPTAPDFVAGIGNLRGTILPIVNLRKRLGLDDRQPNESTRVVVLNQAGVSTGLVVDSVSEVMTVDQGVMEEPPTSIAGIEGQYLDAIAKVDEGKRLVLILNEKRILPELAGMEATLNQRRADAAMTAGAIIGDESRQVVTFLVGEEEYAIDIMQVKEIIKISEIVPVPKAPDYILGVMSLRNHLLPIMNLERRFGAGPAGEIDLSNKRVVVVELDGMQTGIQVDSVSQVLTIGKTIIEQPPQIVKRKDADCLQGIAKLDAGKRLIVLLDAAKLVSLSDLDQLGGKNRELDQRAETERRAEAADEIQLVCFRVNKQEYAIDIMKVQEIIRVREITSVPHAKSYMQGVINLRGTVVPVVDMRSRFGLGSTERSDSNRIVVVNMNGNVTGLIVDSVSEVLRISKDVIEKPPASVSGVEAKFIDGVGKLEDGKRIIVMVRVENLLVENA